VLIARDIALEMAKYLSKELNRSKENEPMRVKKLSRSKGWAARCVVKDAEVEREPCEFCETKHDFAFVGKQEKLISEGAVGLSAVDRNYNVAFYPLGGAPGRCWGSSVEWRESLVSSADLGLVDYGGKSWQSGGGGRAGPVDSASARRLDFESRLAWARRNSELNS